MQAIAAFLADLDVLAEKHKMILDGDMDGGLRIEPVAYKGHHTLEYDYVRFKKDADDDAEGARV